MEPHSRNHSAKASVQRKRLRETMGVSERVFWEAVRKDRLGFRFRRQVSVGRYHLDFYCAAAGLAVEIDGEHHERSAVYDARRDADLLAAGIETLRIPSLDLFDPQGVAFSRWLARIEARCEERVAEFERVRDARRGPLPPPLPPTPFSPEGDGGFPGLDPEALPQLDAAVATAARLAREWGLEIEGPLAGATCSLVLAAGEFVLRMPLLDWERGTSGLLRAFAPHGGVAVLREDAASGAVLLPRLRPGLPLDTLGEDDATDAWIALARRLGGATGDAPGVEEYLTSLWTKATDLRFDTDAPALARRLLDTSPAPRLLHGDLHHYNVLRSGEAWVAIDPEGVSGDPAYECAAFLRNPVPALGREPDLVGLLERRILRLADGLDLPAARVWGWGFARTALCVWDEPGAFGGAWLRVARALDVLGPRFAEGLS